MIAVNVCGWQLLSNAVGVLFFVSSPLAGLVLPRPFSLSRDPRKRALSSSGSAVAPPARPAQKTLPTFSNSRSTAERPLCYRGLRCSYMLLGRQATPESNDPRRSLSTPFFWVKRRVHEIDWLLGRGVRRISSSPYPGSSIFLILYGVFGVVCIYSCMMFEAVFNIPWLRN